MGISGQIVRVPERSEGSVGTALRILLPTSRRPIDLPTFPTSASLAGVVD